MPTASHQIKQAMSHLSEKADQQYLERKGEFNRSMQ